MSPSTYRIELDACWRIKVTADELREQINRFRNSDMSVSATVHKPDGGKLWPTIRGECVTGVWDGDCFVVTLKGHYEIQGTQEFLDKHFAAAAAAHAPVSGSLEIAGKKLALVGKWKELPIGYLRGPQAGNEPAVPTDGLASALRTVFLTDEELSSEADRVFEDGTEPDYYFEGVLESLADGLLKVPETVERLLEADGRSWQALGDVLLDSWAKGRIPRVDTPDLNIRAVEALGAWSIATGESRATVLARLHHPDWVQRAWAAHAIGIARQRELAAAGGVWADAPLLLAGLAKDSGRIGTSEYPVRAAAEQYL